MDAINTLPKDVLKYMFIMLSGAYLLQNYSDKINIKKSNVLCD